MVARVYSIENGGLPNNLSDTKAGDLIVMLKAALITGYKDKKPMGWKLVFESTPTDSVKRLVVQSQSPNSEQRYYEIINSDVNNTTITMYESWDATQNKGGGRSVSLYVYGSVNVTYAVIVNDYFCHFQWGGKSYWFGDIDELNPIDKSIIMGQSSKDSTNASVAIPSNNSTQNVGSRKIIDINNNALVLQNEHLGHWRGWTNAIDWQNGVTYYYGTDNSLPILKDIFVVELVGKQARYIGTMPVMVFCNNNPYKLSVAENGKKVYARHYDYTESLVFLVDEL